MKLVNIILNFRQVRQFNAFLVWHWFKDLIEVGKKILEQKGSSSDIPLYFIEKK